jgi:hypothetical protein
MVQSNRKSIESPTEFKEGGEPVSSSEDDDVLSFTTDSIHDEEESIPSGVTS